MCLVLSGEPSCGCDAMKTQPSTPPVAQRREHARTHHGDTRNDPYAWLEDADDPAVLEHLRAENAYADRWLEPLRSLRTRLFDEFRQRLREDDVSVPASRGGWLYYTRTRRGLEHPLYCRRRDREGSGEQVLLDVNALAGDSEFCELGAIEVSPDHRMLLYAVDFKGNERYSLHVLDLQTRQPVGDPVDDIDDALWLEDSAHLLYTRMDASQRPCEVWHHRLEGCGPDRCLLSETDAAFFVHMERTLDREYIVLGSASHTTTELHFLPSGGQAHTPVCFRPRRPGVEDALEHRAGEFFLLTNESAPNFRLMRLPAGPFDADRACEVVAHDPASRIEGMDVFARHLVLYRREDGLCRAHVCHLQTGQWHRVAVEGRLTSVLPGDNAIFETSRVRLEFSSYTEPARVYDYDMDQRVFDLKKRAYVPDGYDGSKYVAERRHAVAPDGTEVPLSLVYRADLVEQGRPSPCVLGGYGAYGTSLEPGFSRSRISLLDRGVVCVEAHVRGGGELGEHWRDAGRLACKTHSFDDFIAVAEYLVDQGITARTRLAITGASAGGLLIGAVLNRRPDLFAAALVEVPFVDVLNTMLDPELPLTVIEYEEWGDPRRAQDYFRIRDYAPYEQVRAQAYPALLAVAGLHDSRVAYWEAAKWVARLRHCNTGAAPLLLVTEMASGHGGASGRYRALHELALQYAFLLDRLGVAQAGD